MSDIRLIEAITPSGIGGAEKYVLSLCKEFVKQGADANIFCPKGRPFISLAKENGFSCISWKTFGKFDPITLIKLSRLIRNARVHVIHSHLSTASLIGAFAARLAGIPSIAHVHGLNTARCFKYSTGVIAVSEAVARHLVNQGLNQNRIRIIHNGLEIEKYNCRNSLEAKIRLGYSADAPLFGIFGRLSGEKGQEVALEAMSLLVKIYPEARLVVTGQGRDARTLRLSADRLGISSNIIFTGYVENVMELMSACDAVVVPSLKEGFGLAALEAMALEKPVVASNVGGLPEVVVDGETGLLVPPGNPQELAQAMQKLIADKELAIEMGKCGRKRVEEQFDLSKQAAETLSVLNEI